MDKALETVRQLVKDFKGNEAYYLSPKYAESETRQDFIDKFFTALGWDVAHNVQKDPFAQEVKIENKVETGGSQRRADYAFHVAPHFHDVKFFAEAKKPSRDLHNADYYYQTIRYGWNAGTPIAVLTDFEELIIIDCRYKPDIGTALNRGLAVYRCEEYIDPEKFAKIFYLIGRDAVANGSIEKYAAELPKPRGKAIQKGLFKGGFQPVDEAFLEELDGFRESLAKAFKKANQDLEGEELTEAVQRTIDRLVFIRFLEDKGIEEPEIIKFGSSGGVSGVRRGVVSEAIQDWGRSVSPIPSVRAAMQKSAWSGFLALCKRLEPKYNGLVFKPHQILEGKEFNPPDDDQFADICRKLADPFSPYDFNQIPISILGSIYERFLGKIVHATAKRVSIEEKPEVRKAGGVYYTPQYIVRYIVNETVGKLIEGKTPKEISAMAFADIACGSGSFLIEVYSRLLAYHVQWYAAHPDQTKQDDTYEQGGKLYLSLKKKREILLNNVYGVDIDFQATEVTQLSLYLKLLEDVSLQDAHQFGLFKETILPDLRQNIVCGNSLVGRDILEGNLFDEGVEHAINPMDFAREFPKIMGRGGFDAVVGNPPYRMLQPHNTSDELLRYLRKHFFAADFKIDLFHLFMQRGISLLRFTGMLGYIVPTTVLNNVYVESLREWIMGKTAINSIAVCPEKVFNAADVHTSVLIFTRVSSERDRRNNLIRVSSDSIKKLDKDPDVFSVTLQSRFSDLPGQVWNILLNEGNASIIQKLNQNTKKLEEVGKINRGLITGDRDKYFSRTQTSPKYVPIIAGTDVNRYYVNLPTEFVLFEKPRTAGGCWDKDVHFANHKLVIRQIGFAPTAGILTKPLAVTGNIFTVMAGDITQEMFLLGILNSTLIKYYWQIMFWDFKTSFPQVTIFSLSQVPIHSVDITNPVNKARHDAIVKLVESMLATKERLAAVKTDYEATQLEKLCESLDREIDQAVYELYGLTEEEIKIVESGE
jgi:type I restriction-modification system DNA methylase subunit